MALVKPKNSLSFRGGLDIICGHASEGAREIIVQDGETRTSTFEFVLTFSCRPDHFTSLANAHASSKLTSSGSVDEISIMILFLIRDTSSYCTKFN